MKRLQEWREDNPLRKWRAENGASMSDVANLIGVSLRTVSLWEAGDSVPSKSNLDAMLSLAGKDMGELWEMWLDNRPSL